MHIIWHEGTVKFELQNRELWTERDSIRHIQHMSDGTLLLHGDLFHIVFTKAEADVLKGKIVDW